MAGDWIPMRIGIEADPAVLRIAATTKLDVYGVVGRLQKLWGWANANLTDGTAAGVNFTLLDCIVGVPGFCSAMSSAGWLIEDESGVSFPKFEAWNSQSAKQRALTRNRVATHAAKANAKPNARANGKPNAKANAKPNAQLTLDALGKEEKRREEKGKIVPSELPAPPAGVVPPTSPPPPPEQLKQPRKKSASDQPPPVPPTTALVTTNDPASLEMVPTKETSVHHLAIEEFCNRWRIKYKEKYPFNGGKDGQSVAWMLTQVEQDLSKFTAVVARFLADDDPFYAAGDRHGLGKLRQHFARWLVNQPIQTPQRTKAEREADDIRRYSTSMYDDLPSMYDTDKGNF